MERLGREIERELARSTGGATAAVTAILGVWPRAVGEPVARHAWPLRVARDGTLHVATSSATWAFELDRLSSDIADRLRELLGEEAPTSLRFRPGPIPEPAPAAPAPPPAGTAGGESETPPEVAAEAAGAAAAIDDPELRELVERAARASLAKARSGRWT